MDSVKQATINSAKWGFIEKFSIQGIRFVLGLIMARLLSPDDYGAVAMITIFLVLSETFVDSGFTNALVRNKNNTEDDFCTVFYFNLLISIICCAVLLIAAPYIASFFKMPILCSVLRVLSSTVILNSLVAVPMARLTINLDFKAIAIRNMLANITTGIIGVVLAYLGFGVWALVSQMVLSSTINLVFIAIYCKWIPRRKFSKDSFKSLFGYGSKLLIANLVNRIYMNLTDPVVGKAFSAEALGFYNRGTSLAKLPCDIINDVLSKILFPIMAKIQDDRERLIQVYIKYIKMLSLVIFFACLLLAALAKPAILLLLTDKWSNSIIFLQIYCFACMFEHLHTVNLNLLYVTGRSDLFLKLEILKKTISTIILFSSIPFGVIGVCVSKVIYNQVALFFNTYYTGKLFNLGYIEQFKIFAKYLVFALISCFPAYCLTLLDLNNILTIALGGCVSILLYWLLVHKDEEFSELIMTVKSQFKKI